MALNLWKIGGKPTSYNPLPSGNQFAIFDIGEYLLKFKASSPTNKQMNFFGDNGGYSVDGLGSKIITLTPNPTVYTLSINLKSRQNIYLATSATDIIIQDIQLVQKPLPKLTINGIDGFTSGKWQLHANARVVDDETLELDGSVINRDSSITFNCNPNTVYTFSCEHNGNFGIQLKDGNIANTTWYSYRTDKVFTITTGANDRYIQIWLSNRSLVGTFTFKRPMLNLGTTPAPYERKKGERMVLPTVKGNNLFDGGFPSIGFYTNVTGGLSIQADRKTSGFVPLKPNTTYTFKVQENGELFDRINFYSQNNEGSFVQTNGVVLQQVTLTTPSNGLFVRFTIRSINNVTVMINEGTAAQPYTPYAVQVNKKPKRYVPKKNLFDGGARNYSGFGTPSFSVNTLTISGVWYTVYPIDVKPNTNYFISGEQSGSVNAVINVWADNGGSTVIKSLALNTTFNSGNYSRIYVAFYSGTATTGVSTYKNIQLEEGTTATPYEPYQQVLPRAKTGMRFENGGYMQLPSMTMDSIEIDCVIDSSNGGVAKIVDARSGLANGYLFYTGTVGTGSLKVNGVPSSTIPKNERVNLLYTTGQFTDDVTIFANNIGFDATKGTLYKVTCYLAGQVVAQYDFENPTNLVGDKVLPGVVGVVGKNLFDKNAATLDYFVTGVDGSIVSSAQGHAVSDFIAVKPSVSYVGSNIKTAPGAGVGVGMAFYTSSKTFISSVTYGVGASLGTFNTPSNAAFIRFTFLKVDAGIVQLEEGSTVTPYEPFSLSPVNTKPNLIPSFEDARWQLHANADVMGKDVLRLEASGASNHSQVTMPVKPNQNYLAKLEKGHWINIVFWQSDGTYINENASYTTALTVTTPPNCAYVWFRVSNVVATGTFDFIKPQLYELSGKEGTLFGKPTPLRKTSKRSLYAKR